MIIPPIEIPQIPLLVRAIYYAALLKVPEHDTQAAIEVFGAVIECARDKDDIKQVKRREILHNLLEKICTNKSQ